LLDNFSSDISRFTLPLINQLYITGFTNTKLVDLAKKNIIEIKKISSKCAEIITKITNKTVSPYSQLTLPQEIKDLETFSTLDELLTIGSFNKTSLADWRYGGGKISTDDSYINSLLELQVSVWLCTSQDKKSIMDLTQQAEEFLSLDINRYKELNPSNLIFLCERFMALNLSLIAVKYLDPILPDEPWLSPLLENLLQALYLSEQNDLFFKKLALFSDDVKSESIWLLEAQAYERLQQDDKAITAVQKAIKIDNKNSYSWDLLLYLRQKKKTNKD
ncbi:tetratricopeptide repeat protein, partial [Yersinia sp. 2542 StPb PI]|uniref:tetratricopeptide repeat protein n=1 Tax=Yersinia sp. 2542 StPb PI TaxID=3117408 RepID=UPI003B287A02